MLMRWGCRPSDLVPPHAHAGDLPRLHAEIENEQLITNAEKVCYLSYCQKVSVLPSRSISTPFPALALVTDQTARCPTSRFSPFVSEAVRMDI